MRPKSLAKALANKTVPPSMSAYLSWVTVGDSPELQDKYQIDGNPIAWLTSRGQCTIGREARLQKCLFTAHILTLSKRRKSRESDLPLRMPPATRCTRVLSMFQSSSVIKDAMGIFDSNLLLLISKYANLTN